MEKHKICVLVIDSEPESMDHIIDILNVSPVVSLVETARDADEALLKLIVINPDLVLLEYPTPGKSGRELLKFIKSKMENVIVAFVTNTKQNAAVAIRNGVFNYLLKPVSPEEIRRIVDKVQAIKQSNINIRVREIIEKSQERIKLRFQTMKGYILIDPEEIIYCKSEGIYTEIYLTDDRKELSYLYLSKLEEILSVFKFVRVSRSHLINPIFVRKLFSGKNAIILSANGKETEIKGSKLKIKMLSNLDLE